jgi:spermidine synthase
MNRPRLWCSVYCRSVNFRVARVAPLLFFSGACALVYQIAWLRELRLIFGASTAASAAVLAVFMAGLGAGSLLLSKRAEHADNPLRFYAHLELAIGVSAGVTPLLVAVARFAYLKLGGEAVLGGLGSTVVRLALAAIVLAAPTVLMGGTLPAAARAVGTSDDVGRRKVAVLYGVNTLGAVLGAIAANFVLLEVFGTRLTLWLCCLVNLLVAMAGRALARGGTRTAASGSSAPAAEQPALARGLLWLPPVAAGIAGFAFLLMELVWYRMLGPLLGGSSYTFGLILVMALLGIGLGSLLYSLFFGRSPATLKGFALTCALEALLIAVPYALGDRLAILTILLRPLGAIGFIGHVASWSVITAIVVLPGAILSGIQFPLLIGLFGQGSARVGRHVGLAYFANTLGSIGGSLAGGFGLIPLLTAPACWRVVVMLLAGTAAVSLILSIQHERRSATLFHASAAAAAALVLLGSTTGPTAAWRHSPIGAGRSDPVVYGATKNSLIAWARNARAAIAWEADGRESSIGLSAKSGYAFIVNGKSDGDALTDAPTQVFGGLLGAALHGAPRKALVVGLGTGSTAGWLGRVPTMERVDVVELEPAILRVARDCTPVNEGALSNPKVHVTLADAREVLLTSRERYDLIFSEPSNPYRAGISSLYTVEYYEAAARALSEGGVFAQWMQSYEISAHAIHVVIATLRTAFPSVSIWQTMPGDLIFIARAEPHPLDVTALRRLLAEEPYRSAMRHVWRAEGFEALLAHHVGNEDAAKALGELAERSVNTDDLNLLEFAYARNVGKGPTTEGTGDQQIRTLAAKLGMARPATINGAVDWQRVEEEQWLNLASHKADVRPEGQLSAERTALFTAAFAYHSGSLDDAAADWRRVGRGPKGPNELELAADALASVGDDAALPLIERLRLDDATSADAILGAYWLYKDKPAEAAEALGRALIAYRAAPWPRRAVMARALQAARALGKREPKLAPRLYEAVKQPFALHALEFDRREATLSLALRLPDKKSACVDALAAFEPYTPWTAGFLEHRYLCYEAAQHPRRALALEELSAFVDNAPALVGGVLREQARAAAPSEPFDAVPEHAPDTQAPPPSPPPPAPSP